MAEEKPGEKPEKTTPPTKDADGKAAAAPKKKKKSKGGKGKLIAIAAALAVVLIGGGVTAFFLLSGSGKDKGARQAAVALPPPPLDPGPMTIYDFPKVLADLKTGECRSSYLSARFMVEVGKNYTKDLQAKQAKIVEGVMLHLRSLERKDLVGKAGSDRMRADLISIINNIAKPAKVEGLVFKEFILQ